jgi:hypothetical protein
MSGKTGDYSVRGRIASTNHSPAAKRLLLLVEFRHNELAEFNRTGREVSIVDPTYPEWSNGTHLRQFDLYHAGRSGGCAWVCPRAFYSGLCVADSFSQPLGFAKLPGFAKNIDVDNSTRINRCGA